jgi:hypothetical protein
MPSSFLHLRVPLRAAICGSAIVLVAFASGAPAHAAGSSASALDVPVFQLEATGDEDGSITPVDIPTAPVESIDGSETVDDVVNTIPDVLGQVGTPEVEEDENAEEEAGAGAEAGEEEELALTGVSSTQLAAMAVLLLGLGLTLHWYGGELRRRSLALLPTHIRFKRN